MSGVDITGLDKAEVLRALYNASHAQGLSFLAEEPTTYEDCVVALEVRRGRPYFDYWRGRVLKVDLSGNTFDPGLFDRDCGSGAAQRAIARLASGANAGAAA